MNETTRIKQKNVYAFLRKFAGSICLEDLTLIPHPWGRNLVFYYRRDSILKVAKRQGGRVDLLKEARILAYLSKQDLPVAVPKPLLVHEKGYYLLLSRIDGYELTTKVLAESMQQEKEAFCRCIGAFLAFLHSHNFPQDVVGQVSRSPKNLNYIFERAEQKVGIIKKFSPGTDTAAWEEKLKTFAGSLNDRWVLTHGDFYLKHVFAIRGSTERFAVIDFNFAMFSDPAIDFSELVQGMAGVRKIQEMILAHYPTDDTDIENKIGLLVTCDQINQAYRGFKRSLN